MISINVYRRLARSLSLGSVVLLFGCPSNPEPKPDASNEDSADPAGGVDKAGVERLAAIPEPEMVMDPTPTSCERTVVADVVGLSQRVAYNRLGTTQTTSQLFALARDVEVGAPGATASDPWVYTWLPATPEWQAYETCRATPTSNCMPQLDAVAAKYQLDMATNAVRLRPDRRPRPMVVRANVGDCLEVNFANLLPDAPQPSSGATLTTNTIGFHPVGLPLVDGIGNDGQFAGRNADSLAAPGDAQQYRYFASVEAVHFVSSTTDQNDSMINAGLFGAVHIQPKGAEYYRSQVIAADLGLASTPSTPGMPPTIDYQATFDATSDPSPWRRTVPILAMLADVPSQPGRKQLLYSDLTAIITGASSPDGAPGAFTNNTPSFQPNPALPNRREPYREFTIIYHEPGALVQAFPQLADTPGNPLQKTAKAGADQFGINYGTGGIGAEIFANRLGVGPMAECIDCEYEEFFLSAWSVGDPAMVVDVPAAANVNPLTGVPNPTIIPATLAYYPDDPSNVYHSYLADHVKMRLHHGGATHHVHHLHAHQWLHSPNNTSGHYLDSQLFGPGSSFTLEMVYNGSGNRNQTVGDSIFHCHFYPHFAQGMWGMWRVHDVFEAGTALEPSPSGAPWPTLGARALPDGEIARGTPIPGLVPVPTLPMAPLPSPVYIADGQVNFGEYTGQAAGTGDRWGTSVTVNPGYPFFIPGQAGHRPPHPPMDFAKAADGSELDGGLPRHLIVGGEPGAEYHNLYDFSKFEVNLDAVQLPEAGTPAEQIAMAAHAIRKRPTITPAGVAGEFIYNGNAPVSGAPYADPCYTVEDSCLEANAGNYNACDPIPVANASNPRRYKAADIQHDVVINKDGWHNPQQRMAVLWEDVQPTYSNARPPEPLFFRANSTECIEFWMTNLVPEYYELDNFQVRTPTDILGQHIHLVKFDVTSSDGAGNGFNYEDGTFSYEAVAERIADINAAGGIVQLGGTERTTLPAPEVPQYLCDAGVDNCAQFAGAQTTVQRWWADPLLSQLDGPDRTIRTVFTHDHFGPSTHQQSGLYAGLLVEPEGSTWVAAETGTDGKEVVLGTRSDGGPTSWQAVIKTPDGTSSYREFALEFQDIAVAYAPGGEPPTPYPVERNSDPANVAAQNKAVAKLKSPATQGQKIRDLVGGNIAVTSKANSPGSPVAAPPMPQLISALPTGLDSPASGTYSVNYRSEPLGLRLADQALTGPAVCGGATDVPAESCDPAFAFASLTRANPDLNVQPSGEGVPPALTAGVYPTDPFTPMLRAYAGERVQVRTLVGAHVQMHNFALHGFKWLFEPSNDVSGYRDSQSMGISEHFEMEFQMPPATTSKAPATAGTPTTTATCTQAAPATESFADYLYTASSSIDGLTQGNWGVIRSYAQGTGQCLATVPSTPAAPPAWACPASAPKRSFKVAAFTNPLTYNDSANGVANASALVYTGCDVTLTPDCEPPTPTANAPMSPLILRAAAGECISVSLANNFDPANSAFTNPTALTQAGALANSVTFDEVTASPSVNVGLHPQMLSYDPQAGSGINVGFNPTQTAGPGKTIDYTWYAGILNPDGTGTPVEFGGVNLFSADPLRQSQNGLVGAMIIEPAGSTWTAAESTLALATVTTSDSNSFSDAVLITIDTRLSNGGASGAPTNSANFVLANYASEPITSRFSKPPGIAVDSACQYSNDLLFKAGDQPGDPVTPIYAVEPGAQVRFRVVHPWGGDQQVFEIFGHSWQEEPFLPGSTVIGSNPDSEVQGFRAGWGSTDRLNVVIESAGGPLKVAGDYIYRLRTTRLASSMGAWGVLRVGDVQASTAPAPSFCAPAYPQ